MEAERNRPVLPSRSNEQFPAKQTTPPKVKKSVSVAGVFKRRPTKVQDDTMNVQPTSRTIPKTATQYALDEKAQSLKARLSSRSPQKEATKVSRKKSDQHPLAAAFKDTTDDYRRQLYNTTSYKINNTLATLIHNIYENSLQALSPDPHNTQISPIRLTIPAKFEREALKLYQSISAYKIGLTRTNTDGTKTKFSATLETRMTDYADLIATQKAEIAKLKEKWEAIVGEIWKVGVQCLGEEVMESMLFTKKQHVQEMSSSPTKAESTLFVPEQETSPSRPTARGKKRVAFVEDTDEDMQLPWSKMNGPLYFLYQPSRLRIGPVPNVPALPKRNIEDVKVQVKELGQKEFEELKKAERDYKVYWQRKNERLAQVFGED